MTPSPSHDHAGGEIGGPSRPTLADRAAAATTMSKTGGTAEFDKLLEHAEAGAYARSVLTEQLEAARLERDGTLDMMETYQEQFDAEQLRVQQLELAIADLDEAAKRTTDLERTIVPGPPDPPPAPPGRPVG
jgi:hypothetical protein